MSRSLLIVLGVCAGMALFAPSALADTRYAEPGGDGPAGSCPQADPCDIQAAVEDASVTDGDEVIVLSGTYATGADSINVAKAIDVHGQAGASRPAIVSTATQALSVNNAEAVVADLEIEGSIYPLVVSSGTAERIFAKSTGGIFACLLDSSNANGAIVRDSVCWNTHPTGAGAGLEAGGLERFGVLRNVIAIGSGAGGQGIKALASPLIATNGKATIDAANVIAIGLLGDVFVKADLLSQATVELSHSNYSSQNVTGASASATPVGSGSNQTDPPLFVSEETGDFHQLADSPTIDGGGGDPLLGSLDFDGEARTQGDAPDIGADEFTVAPADDGTPAGDITAPKFWVSKFTPRRFAPTRARRASKSARRKKKMVKRGATMRWRLSESALVTIRIQRVLPGRVRRVGRKRRCVKPTRGLVRSKAKRCIRLRNRGVILRGGGKGLSRFFFSARIKGRALRPGRYRMALRATDAAGNASEKTYRRGFRIIRPR